jgi:hypothetical protein
MTMLPAPLVEPLKRHLARVKDQHDRDLANGRGSVALPTDVLNQGGRGVKSPLDGLL